MTSEPVILPPDATVAEALARIREPQLSPAVAAQVFVTRAPMATPTGRYLGMVHFQRLLREPPADLLGGVVDNDIDPLRPATPLPEITRRMATYDLVAMPVVDRTQPAGRRGDRRRRAGPLAAPRLAGPGRRDAPPGTADAVLDGSDG